MRTRTLLLTGVLLAVFYAVTAARNRTEAEDAFDFAWAVERVEGRAQLHPHHLAYIPVMKALCGAVRRLAGPVRSHAVMAGAGAVAAAACVVLLAGLLAGPLGAGRRRAWAAAAGLAVSYGFWRYAAEAEVYAPMLLLVLGAWTMAARARRPSGTALSGALGGVAVLLHIFAAIPALGAIPMWLWMRRGWRHALTHGAVAALLAAGVYAWAGLSPLSTIGDAPSGDLLRREGGVSAASFVRAGVGLGQALVSGNFLFAQPRFAAAMQARYPARMLEEEAYMGRAARPWMRIVPWATLVALIASILAVAVGGMRSRPADFQALEAGEGDASKDWKPALAAAAAWFLAHAALLVWKEPGNPELWIAALPALWIVAATSLPAVRAAPAPFLALAAVLAAHNWAGGLAMLRDPAGDYHAAKAAAVLAEARAGDTVVTAGGPVFFRYLRYHCAAEVVDAWVETEESFKFQVSSFKGEARSSSPPPSTLHRPPSGRLFVLGDVFDPPESLQKRFPEAAERLRSVADGIRKSAEKVRADPFGGVFRIP